MARAKTRSRRHVVIAVLILVALGMIVLDSRGRMAGRVRTVSAHVFAPSQRWLRETTLSLVGRHGDTWADDRWAPVDLERLGRRVREAEALNAQLAVRNAALQDQIREMQGIARELKGYPLRQIPANVLAREYIVPDGGLQIEGGSKRGIARGHWVLYRYISQGQAAGVRDGEHVVTPKGLAGVVQQVGPRVSLVKLVTSAECRLTARIVHWDGQARRWVPHPEVGVAEGTGDGRTLRLLHIPSTVDARPGDYVVTAASRAGSAEYLIIGEVVEVSRRPTDLTHTIILRPRVDLDRLDRVYVLSPGGSGPAE